MEWLLVPKGLLIGLSVAAPVGPLGVLCIRRTLAHGRWTGFVSGLGVASADAVYGAIAAFGLTSISAWLVGIESWVRIVGGLFLCGIGWRTLRATPSTVETGGESSPIRPWRAYLTTFGLTLTNPMTILSFTAIFAGVGLATGGRDPLSAAALVIGVFTGSALWWLLLASGTGLLRTWFSGGRLTLVNRVSGLVILAFGLAALASTLR
jgi:threonine/homoserine/homoserine lactone efflux protein